MLPPSPPRPFPDSRLWSLPRSWIPFSNLAWKPAHFEEIVPLDFALGQLQSGHNLFKFCLETMFSLLCHVPSGTSFFPCMACLFSPSRTQVYYVYLLFLSLFVLERFFSAIRSVSLSEFSDWANRSSHVGIGGKLIGASAFSKFREFKYVLRVVIVVLDIVVRKIIADISNESSRVGDYIHNHAS